MSKTKTRTTSNTVDLSTNVFPQCILEKGHEGDHDEGAEQHKCTGSGCLYCGFYTNERCGYTKRVMIIHVWTNKEEGN